MRAAAVVVGGEVVVVVVVVVVDDTVVVVDVGTAVVEAVGFIIVIATSMEPPNSLKHKTSHTVNNSYPSREVRPSL